MSKTLFLLPDDSVTSFRLSLSPTLLQDLRLVAQSIDEPLTQDLEFKLLDAQSTQWFDGILRRRVSRAQFPVQLCCALVDVPLQLTQ